MTVELAAVTRADMSQQIMVVGNLIGLATVETTPKVNGRLASVSVRLGDRVSRGQQLAKIEDSELLEQIKQAEASFAVAAATIRQREADLGAARTNLDRSRNLYERQLLPRQTFDDAEARNQAAQAQVELAQAQHQQSKARIDELKIDLSNTVITSPVNGFIGKRTLDQGAWVTPNSVFLSVVDISSVRIVANVVERDLRRITMGLAARVEVDAFPGEKFTGRVANIAPGPRSGHAHGAGRGRNPELGLPAEARHVCARQLHDRSARQCAGRAGQRHRRLPGQEGRVPAPQG